MIVALTQMFDLDQLLETLGYTASPFYCQLKDVAFEFQTAHLFRTANEIGVHGIYVFETSPPSQNNILPKRPAIYVADAQTEDQATAIHKSLWNLNFAPFIIIRLPHQIRIYTGFSYSNNADSKNGLLHEIWHDDLRNLRSFTADAIDSGEIWKKYDKELKPDHRVDMHLLKSLENVKKLLTSDGLPGKVAHALIGKYVYLGYLRGRKILTDRWLNQQGIGLNGVFSEYATREGLRHLIETLETEINGCVFPIDFEKETRLKDRHISWVASIFRGHKLLSRPGNMPEVVFQLHLPFEAYDFRYIPVETLSAIYEQFIHEKKEKGAVYTPEVLADYLLSEVESAKVLKPGMQVLDPACGSGIFLVLAYRGLIEKRLEAEKRQKLDPGALSDMLAESIYGIEREGDACYVAAFSLILTLLHYAEPSELEKLNFRLPNLHNSNIFECDFFNIKGKEAKIDFWKKQLKFDWIVGNPPWIGSKKSKREEFADKWIKANSEGFPVGNNSVAEAFSWLVTKLLKADGIVGLVMPATSLFNHKSKKYRQKFFTENTVYRITNFANLRDVLFDGRTTYPAATFIYKPQKDGDNQTDILHYGPFSINQISGSKQKPWSISIYENEIQVISPHDANTGEMAVWKAALWGSYLDKRIMERIQYQFSTTLGEYCNRKGWPLKRDVELRNYEKELSKLLAQGETIQKAQNILSSKLEHHPKLKDEKIFEVEPLRRSKLRYSIPNGVLQKIGDQKCYLRKRGGESGLQVMHSPHIIVSPIWGSYVIYSDEDFLMAPKHIGIKSSRNDANHLRAFSVYLNSSLVTYYLFFTTHEWGVFRQANWISPIEVRRIPTPEFKSKQIEILSQLQRELAETEKDEILKHISELLGNRLHFESFHVATDLGVSTGWSKFSEGKSNLFAASDNGKNIYLSRKEKRSLEKFVVSDLRPWLQKKIDDVIFELFKIPDDIRLVVEDFMETRLPLDKSTIPESVNKSPSKQELLAYAVELREELDDFVMGEAHHRISMTKAKGLIVCTVEISNATNVFSITEKNIEEGDLTMTEVLADVSESLKKQVSQWVYFQRGLRLFDGPRIYICKAPRLIDWTRTQAIQDAAEIIGQIAETTWNANENRSTQPQAV